MQTGNKIHMVCFNLFFFFLMFQNKQVLIYDSPVSVFFFLLFLLFGLSFLNNVLHCLSQQKFSALLVILIHTTQTGWISGGVTAGLWKHDFDSL